MFVESAKEGFQVDLLSIVLFGSAVEGRLRPTSDVNVMLVLRQFDQKRVNQIRDSYRMAHAAVRLNAMFILESEIDLAAESFAVKFMDIMDRRRILYGADPFANLTLLPDAVRRRLKQVLMNLTLRLREHYVLTSLREEQLATEIADATGPIRAAAAAILHLEGHPAPSPKEALERCAAEFTDRSWADVLRHLTEARMEGRLPPGVAGPTLFALLDLIRRLLDRAESLATAS